jgi:hypothetical protein
MNFQNLLAKMKEIDEGLQSQDKYVHSDQDVEECGGMPSMGPMSSMSSMATKQQDNVSVNVNMSGQGAGGIRDLMAILKNIDQGGGSDDGQDVIVGMEEFANEPGEQTAGIDAVTQTGDDLHSKGGEAEKVNGGGNPMQKGVSESLLAQLNSLYQEVKLK